MLVERLRSLPIPVVIAVNGIAAGGGAALALAGDLVIAARSASFRYLFVDLGLMPDMGATWQLPRLVGRARARGLSLLGEAVDASTAAQWGLIWQVVDDEALDALDLAAVSYQIVLTKADKLKKGEAEKVQAETRKSISKRPAAFPAVLVTSAEKGTGMPELRAEIMRTTGATID